MENSAGLVVFVLDMLCMFRCPNISFRDRPLTSYRRVDSQVAKLANDELAKVASDQLAKMGDDEVTKVIND